MRCHQLSSFDTGACFLWRLCECSVQWFCYLKYSCLLMCLRWEQAHSVGVLHQRSLGGTGVVGGSLGLPEAAGRLLFPVEPGQPVWVCGSHTHSASLQSLKLKRCVPYDSHTKHTQVMFRRSCCLLTGIWNHTRVDVWGFVADGMLPQSEAHWINLLRA